MAKNKRVVVFGASSVYGHFDLNGGFAEQLRQWRSSQSPSNLTYILGVPGEFLSQMIARFEREVDIRKPDLIILCPGINDLHRRKNPQASNFTKLEDYSKQLEQLLEISSKLADTWYVSQFPICQKHCAPLANTDWYYLEADLAAYLPKALEIAKHYSQQVIDIYHPWLECQDHLASDGLHCNPFGHRKIFEAIKSLL